MEIWEAIEALKEGKKIRVEEWPEDEYVYLRDHKYLLDEDNDAYEFDYSDFICKWELYEEPEETKNYAFFICKWDLYEEPEVPKTYNFMEAVQLIKEGKKVKRRVWPKDKFLVYEYEPYYRLVLICRDESLNRGVEIEDIEATDWVIVDEE